MMIRSTSIGKRRWNDRVVYMPGRDLTLLAEEWMAEGLPADFPCVLVSRAAQPDQQVQHTTLWHLGSAPAMQAPSFPSPQTEAV